MSDLIDSKVPWIGKMPSKWNIIRFKDKYKNKKEIAGNKSLNYERIALTLNGVIKRPKDDSEGLQPKDFDTYQIIEKNDFVFKMIDLQNISTSRVGLSPYTGLVSPAYLRFSPKNELENTEYMKYYLMCLYYNCVFNNLGGDGVRSSLSAKDMGQLMCPYPNDVTQDRIVTFLNTKCSKIDELIAIQEQEIEKLKAYKQSLITEVVTKGLDPNAEMKDIDISWLSQVPVSWKSIRIKYLLRERKERSITGKEEPLSMSQKYGLVPTKDLEAIPNIASTYIGSKLTYVNDLVFNKLKAHLGVFSVSKYDGLVSPDYAVYYSTGLVNLKYLEYLFKTPQCISEFKRNSTGIAPGLMRLYTDKLFSIKCPFPSQNEQIEIVKFLDKKCFQVDSLIDNKENKISKLNEYKKSLIYEYVTGKKEVR